MTLNVLTLTLANTPAFFHRKIVSSFSTITLKCLSIGTPKIINFPFVSNGKLMIFRCPNIQTDYNKAVLCLNFGTPEIMNFPFGTNGKFIIFRCPNI